MTKRKSRDRWLSAFFFAHMGRSEFSEMKNILRKKELMKSITIIIIAQHAQNVKRKTYCRERITLPGSIR